MLRRCHHPTNLLPRDTIARVATPSWPKRFVIIGSALVLGASGVAILLMALDGAGGGIDYVVGVAIPIALLAAVIGAILALIGSVRRAFDFPSQKLAVAGVGFDDPTAFFAVLLTFAPSLIGAVCLTVAVARRGRAS